MVYSVLDQNVGMFSILNHNVRKIDDKFLNEVEKFSGQKQYYEIIRCIDKVPLFFKDHMERLVKSASDLEIDTGKLRSDVLRLISIENIINGNIKIIVTKSIIIMFPSAYYYPGTDEYTKGVNLGILNWERYDPNSKVVRADYKQAVSEKLNTDGPFGKYFELLLAGKDGVITEGSRSNVFFTYGNKVFTAPDNLILKGITRKYVQSAIKSAGADLIIKCFDKNEISESVDGSFITGTSINVLPVYSIEDIVLNSANNPVINKISDEYKKIVKDYISKNTKSSFIN